MKSPKTSIKTDDASTEDTLSRRLCERVQLLRKENGWTLEELATRSGVSRSMLSQIERGKANPTLAVAYRIAGAFSLALAELVDVGGNQKPIEIIRSSDGVHLFRDDKQCRIRTLSPLSLEKNVEFYEVVLRPNGALRSAAHFKGTREFLTVEKGAVRLQSGDTDCELKKGDSAHYRADVPHSIENLRATDAVVFLVDIYE